MRGFKILFTKTILFFCDLDIIRIKIENSYIKACYKNAMIGVGSKFYYPAKVINYAASSKIIIGKNTHINGDIMVWPYSDGIRIGDNSYIGINSFIRAEEFISIGNDVLIAHNVNIIDTDSHEIDYKKRAIGFNNQIEKGFSLEKGDVKTAPIIIEDNVWISYNVSILKGVKIGRGAIVAAGSVVTKDVEPFTLVAGNPAKFIKKLGQDVD
jgi:acetyltransferase-like isoleucine patch superfamily enzyme